MNARRKATARSSEYSHRRFQVLVVGYRDARDDKSVGIGERQWLEQHCVRDTEDCRGRADAECEREHDHDGEAGGL